MPSLVCPNCKYQTDGNEQFCYKCGTRLTVVPEEAFCRSCGTELKPDAIFCSQCGTKLDAVFALDNTPSYPPKGEGNVASEAHGSTEQIYDKTREKVQAHSTQNIKQVLWLLITILGLIFGGYLGSKIYDSLGLGHPNEDYAN